MAIHEVIICVGEVDAAVEFYTRVVGLTLVRVVEHSDRRVAELDADGQRVTLVPADGPGVHLVLPTDDASKVRRRLARKEVEAQGPVHADGGAWVGFADPWGNRLGFWQPDAERPGAAPRDEATPSA